MILTSDAVIHRVRRDLTLSSILKIGLGLFALTAMVMGSWLIPSVGSPLALAAVGIVWLVLSYRSVQGSRAGAGSPSLIAAGEYEEAEERIGQSLRSFSLFRNLKLNSVHHLAMLRHAQRRWADSAALCREILRERRAAAGLAKPSNLMLADALLELDDVSGAYSAILSLYDQRLSLGEATHLIAVQMDYLSRIGAWESMMESLPTRAQMMELLPARLAGRTLALLALAAHRTNRADLAQWLRRRAVLLADPAQLVAERPMLKEVMSTEF